MKKRSVLLFSICIGLFVSGCGRQTDNQQYDIPGAKIRYAALGARVRGLDPSDIGDVTSSSVASQSYECLYQYHYLKRPYELIPCLAESMPTVSKDGLTYTIKLRKDVYFFDDPCFPNGKGRQLVADDFIYTWKRIANIKYLSKNWWVFDGKIAGLDEFRQYSKQFKSEKAVDYSKEVEGLKALDNFTLQIKLKKPWPQITYLLAHLPTAPMAKEAVDHYGQKITTVMVGTGPFYLKSWQKGGRMVLLKNPKFRKELYPNEGEPSDEKNHYLDDKGKQLPLVDGIVFDVVEEEQPLWLLFMQGKIDSSAIPKDFYNKAITTDRKLTQFLKDKGIDLLIHDDPSTFWFGFNMDDPVVGKNLPLRRAMNMAWDRKEFVDIFRNGRGIPAIGVIPPDYKEYNKDLKNPYAEYNVEKAIELMKEAKKIAGGDISLTLSLGGTDTTVRQMGQYFKRSMAKIGLNVKLDFMDWPLFQDSVNKRQIQIFAMGWVGDYPDAQTFLQLFYSPYSSPGPNNFNYRNSRYDELYQKVEVMQDTPERVKIYRQMEQILCDNCPCIFDFHGEAFVPYYKYLKNYKPNAFAWGAAKYVNIDLKLRKELIGR